MRRAYLVAGLVAAVAVCATGAGWPWALAAFVLTPMLPMFVKGAWTGVRTPSRREDAAGRAEVMSGTQFEDYVANVARGCGLPVIMTPLSGDWGVDLIVGSRPNRLAVQCKRSARPVGPAAVQEVVAGAPMQDCAQTMVVTNNEFTPAARALADLHGCHLVTGGQLPQLRALLRGVVPRSVPRPVRQSASRPRTERRTDRR
ncbi:MAG: restriction endonuclease [Mycobacterium sp.]